MTVINTSYSSIEEAWADSYLSPSLQKKQKKKKTMEKPNQVTDPICDLYEMGSHYPEDDIVSYANKFYDKHEKAKYQKALMRDREKNPKVVEIDVSDDMPYGAPTNRNLLVNKQHVDNEDQRVNSRRYIDDEDYDTKVKKIYNYPEIDDDDASESSSEYDFNEKPSQKQLRKLPPLNSQERDKILYDTTEYYDDDGFQKKVEAFSYFDLILYILSGIILIFMMEQFVKLGMMIKS